MTMMKLDGKSIWYWVVYFAMCLARAPVHVHMSTSDGALRSVDGNHVVRFVEGGIYSHTEGAMRLKPETSFAIGIDGT